MVDPAYIGEDVSIKVTYDSGGTDPDSAPSITITDNSDGTELESGTAMTSESTGVYSFAWDTSTANGAGHYNISITGEFGGETKINKDSIRLVE